MTPLCFLDTETTGLHHMREPWEVALIRRDEDGTESETCFLLDVDLHYAQPDALEIGGFYQRHPHGAAITAGEPYDPLRSGTLGKFEAARLIDRYTDGAVLVVNNPSFDVPLLERIMLGAARLPAWHYRPLDIIAEAAGFLQGIYSELDPERQFTRPAPPYRSEQLSKDLGVEPPSGVERHTALGDARWVRDLWDVIHEEESE